MFGLVRSNPVIVFIQILSRVFLVWGVANYIPHVSDSDEKNWMVRSSVIPSSLQAQLTIGIFLAVTAWSVTEIIRYAYYALNLFQAAPQWLTWCRSALSCDRFEENSFWSNSRYTFFIVLYPLGVTVRIFISERILSSHFDLFSSSL